MTAPNRSESNGRTAGQLLGAFRAGVSARDENLPSAACPYLDQLDPCRRQWLQGWLDARWHQLYGDT